MTHRPLITIVTPVYNPPLKEFRKCIQSVLGQTVENWQWCITDDGSKRQAVREIQELESDYRVSFRRLDSNVGIAEATNDAIRRATGEFIAFLDQDDELAIHALQTFSQAIADAPDSDVLYSDEDKIDVRGNHYDVFRKPNWSPERLRHQNFLNHLTVIRRELINEVGLLSPAFDGSQDYDLVLRASEKARRITHIPTVLYHWRAIGTSIASNPDAKPEAHTAAAKAVSDHLSRLEIEAEVGLHKQNSYVTVKRVLRKNPRTSILIPSCGSRANIHGEDGVLVENCVESILSLSTYSNYEIIVILDDFCPESTRNFLHERNPERLKVVEFNGEFNFSAKVNLGAVKASGEILIPLNDDTKVVTNTWIEELLVYLEDDDVGISAPLLLLENGSIQSAGHFFRHGAHHFAPGLPVGTLGYGGLLTFPAERSGITFACAAIKRSVYEEVGGLSEKFPRSFNDVDFCNKVRKFGYRIIWTPQSVLYHFESLTRDPKVHFSEVEQLYGRWGHLLSMPDEYLADVS